MSASPFSYPLGNGLNPVLPQAPTEAAVNVRFVTATRVQRAPTCSFKFMFDSGMPRDWVKWSRHWGSIVPMEEPVAGQDTQIYAFRSGHGQVLSGAFCTADSADPRDSKELLTVFSPEWLPQNTIFLIDETTLSKIALTLKNAGVVFEVHHSNRELSTA